MLQVAGLTLVAVGVLAVNRVDSAVDLVVARSRIVPFYRYNFVLYYQYRMSGFSR